MSFAAPVLEHGFLSLQDDLLRLRLNGRATDAQFAQNPLPVARSMGRALGALHTSPIPDGVSGRTEIEVEAAMASARSGVVPPGPFARVRPDAFISLLSERPIAGSPVLTHGAPVVGAAILVDSVTSFEGDDSVGLDPAERDLAIVLRSIAETFTSEVTTTFLEGYVEAGGSLPHGPALDWYGVVAAFR